MTLEKLADSLSWLEGKMLVGLSGGADSMALCSVLLVLRDRGQVMLEAVHVNHGLRGQAADEDEAFVTDFCRKQNIPCSVFHLTPPANPGEGWAREARYAAFQRAMEQSGADALVLAHHREDQAETLLMHLMRGTGLDGLCGMRQQSQMNGMTVLRPLLHVSKAEMIDALQQAGQLWREDASNATDAYLRNRVRHQVMPLLEDLAPGIVERMGQTAELLQWDSDALNKLAQEQMPRDLSTYLSLPLLQKQMPAVRTRILRLWWQSQCHSVLDAAHTQGLASLLDAPVGAQYTLPQDVKAYRGYTHLHLVGEKALCTPVSVHGAGCYAMGKVQLTIESMVSVPGNGKTCQALPAAMVQDAVLRTRQQGDFIRPFGQEGRQSLQDYLVDHKIDAPFRDQLPLLCMGQEVLLVCGVGAGHVPRWQEGFLKVIWSGEMPWLIHQ